MAERVFFFHAHFGKRTTTALVGHEHGVVTKPTLTTFGHGNGTFTHTSRPLFTAIGVCHQGHGAKPCSALCRFHITQHAEQLRAVVGIRGVVAGETRSVHAGCAI